MRRGVRVMTVVGAAAAVWATTTTAGAAPAAPTLAPAAAPAIHWKPCGGRFTPHTDFCARLLVPLDYDHPQGPQISLALIKQPATDPAHRLGSLLVNPGGPGGSGVNFVANAGPVLLSPRVRARFDIVGFDPRGVGSSTALRCFATRHEAQAVRPDFPYPNTPAEQQQQFADDAALESACAQHGGAILDHMATADVARDMDRIRQGVGDRALTYYGLSYGSYLGDTYANLFPGNVRALVIDGVPDPVEWATGTGNESDRLPFSSRLRSDIGSRATLAEFFRLCDANPSRCAFAPDSARRYAALYRQLQQHPLTVPGPDGSPVDFDETYLVQLTLGNLYGSSQWADFATELAQLEQAATGAGPSARAAATAREAVAATVAQRPYFNSTEGFPGVACTDSVDPTDRSAWPRAAQHTLATHGIFGPVWTWSTSACAQWPGHDDDRYLGPFTHRTARPVLVVGNEYDPATPYQGAQHAAALLPNSTLLTVHGWGHTSLFLSGCATAAISRYLLTSTPPPAGTVCEQDDVPFAGPAQDTVSGGSRTPRVLPTTPVGSFGPYRPSPAERTMA